MSPPRSSFRLQDPTLEEYVYSTSAAKNMTICNFEGLYFDDLASAIAVCVSALALETLLTPA